MHYEYNSTTAHFLTSIAISFDIMHAITINNLLYYQLIHYIKQNNRCLGKKDLLDHDKD